MAIKLATVVFVAVRGFQYAWPPLAYSIESDEEAARLYSLVTTYYALATGVVVCGVALLGRWLVRLLAAPHFFGAHRALPWLALGWALYGLYLVFVVIAGRARVTSRNLPAAAAGLVVNVALLLALVPRGGLGLGIAGAGIALCGAYVAMLLVIYALTRSLFRVGFEWGRLAKLVAILAGVAVSGELLLPASRARGLREPCGVARAGAARPAADALLPPARVAPGRAAARGRCARSRARSARATARSRPTPRTRCATSERARGCTPRPPRAGPRRGRAARSR